MVEFRRRPGTQETGGSLLSFGERKQEVSYGFVYKRREAVVGGRVFVFSVGLTNVRRKVLRVRNMLYKGSCLSTFGSWLVAGRATLRADCDFFVFCPSEEDGWRSL